MPHLFGQVPDARTRRWRCWARCGRRASTASSTSCGCAQTSPIADWLRSLARELHAELGGPGVGALGMCFTGGFALAMMVDDSVAAPVLAQPSLPFPVGKARAADLNLSPADLAKVKERAAAGCEVLGLRYTGDMAVGTRFDTLTRELGDAVHPGRVPRPQALHPHRAPPAGGRRPGAGVLPGEAAGHLRASASLASRHPIAQVLHCGQPAPGVSRSERGALRRSATSPLVGTPVPAVTSTCGTSGSWLTDVPRSWRTASAMPFMPWM